MKPRVALGSLELSLPDGAESLPCSAIIAGDLFMHEALGHRSDHFAMLELRQLLAHLGYIDLYRLQTHDVIESIGHEIRRGSLTLSRHAASRSFGQETSDFSEPGPLQKDRQILKDRSPGEGDSKATSTDLRRSATNSISGATAFRVSMQAIADSVNPSSSVVNCGHIIDAVRARLTGTDKNATAPAGGDGSFDQISARFDTQIKWGHSFDDAFDIVRKSGDGTIAVVGIDYGTGSSHVVVMTNRGGHVGIVEAQNWSPSNPREVIMDSARARKRYGASSDVGIGIVGSKRR